MHHGIRRLALATLLVASPAWADDAPKPADAPKDPPKPRSIFNTDTSPPMHSVGTITGKLSKSSDSEITLKVPQLERKTVNWPPSEHARSGKGSRLRLGIRTLRSVGTRFPRSPTASPTPTRNTKPYASRLAPWDTRPNPAI